MRRKYWLMLLGGLTFFSIIIYNLSETQIREEDSKDYIPSIQKERQEKDNLFKATSNSPLREEQKEKFKNLDYFSVNEDFKTTATLENINPQEALRLPLSDGNEEIYLKYAWANFTLKGQKLRALLLKKSKQDPRLFLIFTDATSGKETYAGGRYLDIPHQRNEMKITLDFNQAYNPYCAYNPDYACPLPLAENDLGIEILAGEKNSPLKAP